MSLPADAKKLIVSETLINFGVNTVLAIVITLLAFSGRENIPALGGPDSGLFGIIPGTFLFTTIITIVLSFSTRRRLVAGKVEPLPTDAFPRLRRLLPVNPVLRGLLLGVMVWLCLVPATLLLASLLLPATLEIGALLVFFVVYFALLTVIVVPTAALRSLLPAVDRPPPA